MQDLAPQRLAQSLEAGVLTLTLGHGPAHALSRGAIRDLHAALDTAAVNAEVRAVIVHGPGRIFCAGHDLKEIARHRADVDHGLAYLSDLFEACSAMMVALAQMPQPTIAVADGIATAAGLQLLASCSMAVVGPQAQVCLPGVRNGGFCTTPAVAVSRVVGPRALADLALTGENRDADWALRVGLVNQIADDPLVAAQSLANAMAGRNAPTLQAGWRAARAQAALPLAQAYALATPVMIGHFMDPGRLQAEADSRFV